MCLGICGQVVAFSEEHAMLARVDVEGVERDINMTIVAEDGVQEGDWVLIHMGIATEVLSADDAEQARRSLDMMGPGGSTPGWSWSP